MIKKKENRNYIKYNLKEMEMFFSHFLNKSYIMELTHYRLTSKSEYIQKWQELLIKIYDETKDFTSNLSIENFKKLQEYIRKEVRSKEFENIVIDIINEFQEKQRFKDEWRSFVKTITAIYFLINIGNIQDFDYKTAVFLDNDIFKEEIKLPYLKDHLNPKIYRSLVSTFNNRASDMKYDTVLLQLYTYNYICLQILKNLQCHLEGVIDIEVFSKNTIDRITSMPDEIYNDFMQIYNKILDIIDKFYQDEDADNLCKHYTQDISLDEIIQIGLKILKIKDQLSEKTFNVLIKKIDLILEYWFIFDDYDHLYRESYDSSFEDDDEYGDEDSWEDWDEDWDDDEDEDEYNEAIDRSLEIAEADESVEYKLDDFKLDYNPWKHKSESDYKINTGTAEMTYCNIFDEKTIRINYLDYMRKYAETCPEAIELIPEEYRDKDLKKEYEEELAEIEEMKRKRDEDDCASQIDKFLEETEEYEKSLKEKDK